MVWPCISFRNGHYSLGLDPSPYLQNFTDEIEAWLANDPVAAPVVSWDQLALEDEQRKETKCDIGHRSSLGSVLMVRLVFGVNCGSCSFPMNSSFDFQKP